jgi:hypothetical protein
MASVPAVQVYSASTQSQKEKFEVDLKKEIKKLQRYRDQVKSWASSSEVKIKQPLLDARKVLYSSILCVLRTRREAVAMPCQASVACPGRQCTCVTSFVAVTCMPWPLAWLLAAGRDPDGAVQGV